MPSETSPLLASWGVSESGTVLSVRTSALLFKVEVGSSEVGSVMVVGTGAAIPPTVTVVS